ncbi:MAG: hypothetical protein HC916_19815 [Coleofasciculaceae cyanobacterium SM2_1_6]|nr:hypothetical protein [Coleofasciculaceae cyanobacterium SM2_1_6]
MPQLTNDQVQLVREVLTPDFSALDTEDSIDDSEFEKVKGKAKRDLAQVNRLLKQETRQSSSAVTRAVEAMPNQWLLWLMDGAIPYLNHGLLTLTRRNDRFLRIIKACKQVLSLDATMTPDRLASLFGVGKAEIYHCAVEQAPNNNLEILKIEDLGRLGMQRGADQDRRVEAVVNHYRSVDPTTKVIDFKKFSQDGAWWRDSRGSNDFKDCNTLVLVGTPSRNVEAVRAEYLALGNNPDRFQAYYDALIKTDILQAIGRIRALCRRNEQLRIVILSDFPIVVPGMKVVRSGDITPEALPKAEHTIVKCAEATKSLIDQGLKPPRPP